jgi:hypothetical protein
VESAAKAAGSVNRTRKWRAGNTDNPPHKQQLRTPNSIQTQSRPFQERRIAGLWLFGSQLSRGSHLELEGLIRQPLTFRPFAAAGIPEGGVPNGPAIQSSVPAIRAVTLPSLPHSDLGQLGKFADNSDIRCRVEYRCQFSQRQRARPQYTRTRRFQLWHDSKVVGRPGTAG